MVVIYGLLLAVALLYVGSFAAPSAPTPVNIELSDCYKRVNLTFVSIPPIDGKKNVTDAQCTQLCKENDKCKVSGVEPSFNKCYLVPLPVVFLSYTMTAEQCVSTCTEMEAECKTFTYSDSMCSLYNVLLKDIMPKDSVTNITWYPTMNTWYVLAEKTC